MKEDSVETVKDNFKSLKKAFFTGKTQDVAWRKKQLSQLVLAFTEMEKELAEALNKDLRREEFSSFFTELVSITQKAHDDINSLDEYIKPSKRDTPLTIAPAKSRVIYQPLGAVCIMGAWNFPFITLFLPLISAISAGNCCLMKPSEMSPNSSGVTRKIIETYLDNECIKCVEGGAEISICCSQLKWDKICFTGSSEKGKLVAQAAAKNLVPCLLELGGKCITIVDESANAAYAGKKVGSARTVNSGQVCICPDYVYVHESKKQEFLDNAVKIVKECYGDNPQENKFYTRMVNEFHTKRVLDLTKNHGGKVLIGGEGDIKDRYVAPTIIEEPDLDSPVMQEEIFGPVLPVISFKDIQEVYDHMHEREKPLAMYYFGSVSGENKEKFENHMQAGMMCVNDVLVQAFNPKLPFGGVGFSGQGCYTGIDGFRNFSNAKGVVVRPTIDVDAINKLILPPYSASDQATLRLMTSNPTGIMALLKPSFQSQVQKLIFFVMIVFALLLAFKIFT